MDVEVAARAAAEEHQRAEELRLERQRLERETKQLLVHVKETQRRLRESAFSQRIPWHKRAVLPNANDMGCG